MYEGPPDENGMETYGGSPFGPGEYAPAPQGPGTAAKEILHQHGKQIAILIVLGIAGFFLYDYFIGSLVDVTMEARDTEGMIIGEMEGRLYERESNNPIKTFGGSTTLSLRPGEYRVEWDAGNTEYENPEDTLILVESLNAEDGQVEKAIVEKDIPVNITNLSFPAALVVGQSAATGTLTLENDSTKTMEIELVYGGDFDPKLLDIITQPATLTLTPGQILPVTLSISVPATTTVKNTSNGDPKKGTVRVKYTTHGKGAGYTLFKSFSLDVNPKTPQTFNIGANKLFTKTFTIRNPAKVDSPETVKMDVQIKSAQENDFGQIATWFSWNPTSPINAPKTGESIPVVLNIMAPPTAATDTITGELKIFTGFWTQTIPFTLNLTETLVDLKITLDGSTGIKTYTIAKDPVTGQYDAKNASLKIENTGGLAIENILMDTGNCGEYIKPLDTEFFLDLALVEKGKTGSSKTTTLQITAPVSALPGSTQNCLLQVSYLDPKTGDVIQEDPITVQIGT
ncbi:MAG: hypothetical protein AABW68_00750 [archaeon]